MDMNLFYEQFASLLGLGLEPKNLTFLHVSLRGLVVFIITLAIVRVGHKRSLARKTAFDAILLVILASVLSRAIAPRPGAHRRMPRRTPRPSARPAATSSLTARSSVGFRG